MGLKNSPVGWFRIDDQVRRIAWVRSVRRLPVEQTFGRGESAPPPLSDQQLQGLSRNEPVTLWGYDDNGRIVVSLVRMLPSGALLPVTPLTPAPPGAAPEWKWTTRPSAWQAAQSGSKRRSL